MLREPLLKGSKTRAPFPAIAPAGSSTFFGNSSKKNTPTGPAGVSLKRFF